jgi:hypothetical protein
LTEEQVEERLNTQWFERLEARQKWRRERWTEERIDRLVKKLKDQWNNRLKNIKPDPPGLKLRRRAVKRQHATTVGKRVRPLDFHTRSILNQVLDPIQRFPQCLKSVRIIASAFCLDRGVPEAANRRTQALDRLVPEVQGFSQSVFQDFALCIECLLGRCGISLLPRFERRARIRWRAFQARSQHCFDASNSSRTSWIAFGVIDICVSVHTTQRPSRLISAPFFRLRGFRLQSR